MYPTSVPTHSEEIGTSCSSTEATRTTGGGGTAAAPDLSPQPASATASTMASRRAPTWESLLISIICTTQPPRGCAACWSLDGAMTGAVTAELEFPQFSPARPARWKVFAVDRPERLGLLELTQGFGEGLDEGGRDALLAEDDVQVVFLEAAGGQRLDLAVEAQRSDQPHPVDEARHHVVDAARFEHPEIHFVAGRLPDREPLPHEIPELGRNGRAPQHGDLVSHQVLERRKPQSPDVGRPHEENPFVPGQRFLREVAEARPLFSVERREQGLPLAPEDEPRGTRPREFLERDVLPHRGEDALEHFRAEPRRLGVCEILVRYPLIGDQTQRGRHRRPGGGGERDRTGHGEQRPDPSAHRLGHRRPRRHLYHCYGSFGPVRPAAPVPSGTRNVRMVESPRLATVG